MTYTDQELKEFTQIAYDDFAAAGNANDAANCSANPGRATPGEGVNISEYVQKVQEIHPDAYSNLNTDLLAKHPDWKIAAVFDDNAKSGFYACVIETAPGEAVIAFRGSEDMKNIDNLINDWLKADLGLMGSIETSQHAAVRRFFENPEIRAVLENYDHLTLTGHSLGGNLAEFATIVSEEYGLDGKIDKCVSFDGPGFSDEFIDAYRSQIDNMSGRMSHYQWSIVGSLLCPLPGVDYRHVKVSNDWLPLWRHSTEGLEFDEFGNVKDGNYNIVDYYAQQVSEFSRMLEQYFAGDNMGYNLIGLFIAIGMFTATYGLTSTLQRLYEGGMFLYKELEKWIKNVFNIQADYFKVNTDYLSRDVESIRAYINRVKDNVNDMFASVTALNGMWTGAANKAFTEKFMTEKRMIDDYLKEIDSYVSRLERDSSDYNNCEARAVSMAASVGV